MAKSSIDTRASLALHENIPFDVGSGPASPAVSDAPSSHGARDTPSRAKIPPGGHQAQVFFATPGKPSSSLNSQSNHSEPRKQDAPASRSAWITMLCKDFLGIKDVSQFLDEMGTSKRVDMNDIVTNASDTLKHTAMRLVAAKQKRDITKPLIDYLNVVASKFPDKTRPTFYNTRTTAFPSVDEPEHYTKPDITGTKPGSSKPDEWRWWHAGIIVELKYKTDIFDDKHKKIRDSIEAEDSLIQLAKSARSLLMESGSCHVYVVAVFDRVLARIFRFDRSGFSVTESFNFTTDSTHLPTFLWRLYNPDSDSVVMLGADDTISIPTREEKERMLDAVRKHSFYGKPSFDEKIDDSLWIRAARYKENSRELEIVKCFTFGSVLAMSDGLFGRATRVYRVILEEDVNKNPPTVYALKDAWAQQCRRSEVDFYNLIEKYCEEEVKEAPNDPQKQMILESIAKCHGSIDLSEEHDRLVHNPPLHVAPSNLGKVYDRHHTRLLLTPVGTPLRNFRTTKSFVGAVFTAIRQHQVAYEAGCVHRDISEGNVLFREVPLEHPDFNGFLLDWDYAELTERGVDNFNKWFSHLPRANKDDIDESLKGVTGTFPFMAIQIIANYMGASATPVVHGVHHDLESFYWLLVWMVLRHTSLNKNRMACSKLFDYVGHEKKLAFVIERARLNHGANKPFYRLLEALRRGVMKQNLEEPSDSDDDSSDDSSADSSAKTHTPCKLTHQRVLRYFERYLMKAGWPENDAAIPLDKPSEEEEPRKETEMQVSLHKSAVGSQVASSSADVEGGSSSMKRMVPEGGFDEDPVSKRIKTSSEPAGGKVIT